MPLLPDACRFAESTAQLCAEGEIANPLSGPPGGSESRGKAGNLHSLLHIRTNKHEIVCNNNML
jgi:hypothetical protein